MSPRPTVLLGLLAIAFATVAGQAAAEDAAAVCDASCSSAAYAPAGATGGPAASEPAACATCSSAGYAPATGGAPLPGTSEPPADDVKVAGAGAAIAPSGYLGLLMASLGVAALAGSRRR